MRTKLSLAALLLSVSIPALASDDCDVPLQQWQSRDAVMQMAARQGWWVQRLKIDDGCYEIRGRDAQGRSFKAKLDPQTLRVVKMKTRDSDDRNHDRDRDRERARDRSGGAPPPRPDSTAAPTPAPSPAAETGPASRPGTRATIE